MINKITEHDLPQLKPLLDQSAGYEISLSDETEYFKTEKPSNWFLASRDGRSVGFVRCFPQGDWGTAEFFIDETDPLAESLLKTFIDQSYFSNGFRLRFEVPVSNRSLIELLKKTGVKDKVETYCRYEIDLAGIPQNTISAYKARPEDVLQVKASFENLHPVAESEILKWINKENVYANRLNDEIASAAQVLIYGEHAEIIRVATNKGFLNRGCAFSLLSSVHSNLKSQGIKNIFLKVDQKKEPARSLYEKLGYNHNKSKDEVWLSKIY